MEKLKNIHPGEILKEEFLDPFGITPYRLAKEINIPLTRIMEILKKKRKITIDTALRLSAFFGNSVDFWVGIQSEYEIREEREKLADEISKIHNIRELAYIRHSAPFDLTY
jgi:addiction module HigA family antidote